MLQNPHVLFTFNQVHNPLRLPRKTTSERPKVVRTRHFFTLLTWKRASRHNGVHFFPTWQLLNMSEPVIFFTLLASEFALHHTFNLSSGHTLCFSDPTFRPSGATNHWKNAVFRDFPTFTHLDLLSSDTFSLILFLLLFSSLL